MSTEILGAIPQLAEIADKLGAIGVLLVAVFWLYRDRARYIKRDAKCFRKLGTALLREERYKAVLKQNNLFVDVSDIEFISEETAE